jgi:hypothetical protein
MRYVLRYVYYVLSIIPLLIFPSILGQFGSRAPGFISDGIVAVILIMYLSPLLTFFGILIAAFAPAGSKTGPVIATMIAAFPGLYLLITILLS